MEENLTRYDVEKLIDEVENTSIDIENESEDFNEDDCEDEKRKLYIDKVDKSTSDIFRMIKEKELNLQPNYQRRLVWDKKTMSKFIESLLLSIPIPTIFLAENDNDTYEVIDGQQRLTTIFAFMKSNLNDNDMEELPEYLKDVQQLTLSGLETLKSYNKFKYEDLGEKKRKFNNVSLPIVYFG